MGGNTGKIVSPVVRGLGDIATFGTNEIAGNPLGNATGSLFYGGGGLGQGSLYGKSMFGSGQSNPYVSGPFSLDPNQMAGDQAAITNLADKQYGQTIAGINDVGTANTQRAKDLFSQMLPNIAENAQASHLYDSTGYGQEVGRQQANIASSVANQEAQLKLGALQPYQNMQQQALSRGFSLEDFINQANVAKQIGAQSAPQVGNGKGETGTLLSGAGSAAGGISGLAKLGKAAAPAAAAVA